MRFANDGRWLGHTEVKHPWEPRHENHATCWGRPPRRWCSGLSYSSRVLHAAAVDNESDLEYVASAWDELAVTSHRPFCSPAWMLAWWRQAAPRGSRLRVITVYDGARLIAVAPFYSEPSRFIHRFRLLGTDASLRVAPLAVRGQEEDASRAIARCLAGLSPRSHVLCFDGIETSCPWPDLLCSSWPSGRSPWLHRDRLMSAPTLTLDTRGYEGWFNSKSHNFRQQMRRRRRQLEKEGAHFRLAATEDELRSDLRSLAKLHYARWVRRGGSSVLNEGVERMLEQAGRQLLPENRFRLWSIDIAGETICSALFVSAGGETSYWLGGFDERWAAQQPSLVALTVAVEHAWDAGDHRIDLGGGGQAYKYRLADGEDHLQTTMLIPRDREYLLARLHIAPSQLRRAVVKRIPQETKGRVKEVFRGRAAPS